MEYNSSGFTSLNLIKAHYENSPTNKVIIDRENAHDKIFKQFEEF